MIETFVLEIFFKQNAMKYKIFYLRQPKKIINNL